MARASQTDLVRSTQTDQMRWRRIRRGIRLQAQRLSRGENSLIKPTHTSNSTQHYSFFLVILQQI